MDWKRSVFIRIPKKNKCKKAEWLSEEALQIAEEGREAKDKRKEKRDTKLNVRFPETSNER